VETDDAVVEEEGGAIKKESSGVGIVGDAEEEFEDDAEDEDEPKEIDPAVASAFKDKVKSVQQKQLDEYAKNVEDKVRLHETGWKDRYYSDKCKADDVENHGGREHLFRSYVMGLCWVMKYYYDGCPDWKWFYPFHYAPFASDLRNIERFQKDIKSFELNTPFNPVEQLMAVLPSDSAHAVPSAARWEMMDPESPIIDFYPKDVPVDPNGKAMPWLWVVLLPFIEEDRLLAAL
jgi:5'-3' exoribonuclease 2